jgi:hypothetical protein
MDLQLRIHQEPKQSERVIWGGVYRGVSYEINRFPGTVYNPVAWTYYLRINVDRQIPEQMQGEFWLEPKMSYGRVSHDYMSSPSPLADLYWHGGITFYEKASGHEGGDRWIKAGCDFQHLWDEGKHYDLDDVVTEVARTIDSLAHLLRARGAPMMAWSHVDGKWYPIEEVGA